MGKKLRHEYEHGNPNNIRMCDIRSWTIRLDQISSTITTVQLDLLVAEIEYEE